MSDCIIWPGKPDGGGYGRRWRNGRLVKAHRYALAQVVGWDALEGQQVNHHCDVKLCVNPDHLYLGTQVDNMRDMFQRHRENRRGGEYNGRARLTEDDVREIRRVDDETQEALAKRYGVSASTIRAVLHRKTWRHL